MKLFKFLFTLVLTISIIYALNIKLGPAPPIGKLLNPFGGFWQNADKEVVPAPETLNLPGLNDEVVIKFDKHVIPHIFAQNDHDLYYAQGYVTAFHRLWQMEFQQLVTAGRISEVLGERALDYDREQRRKGLVFGANNMLENLPKDGKIINALQAYTDGVNAYIDQLSYSDYPIEYKLLDYSPEPWTILKSCLLSKQLANTLSLGERDLEHTNALKLFGQEYFELLYPERPAFIDPVIPEETEFDFEPVTVSPPVGDYPLLSTTQTVVHPDSRNGSNNFAVAPSKTANGKAMLANEPDLQLNLPSIWYIAQLKAPGINVFGATLPGAPGVVIGFNDSIAWGATNAKRDLVDWYTIEFKDEEREEYKYDDKWLKTQKVVERFKVRDGGTFVDTLIFTHYGPVTFDRNFKGDGDRINLAMRWVAHDPSNELALFDGLNRAKNYQEFRSALTNMVGSPQNFAFASVTGDVALVIPGKFPVKWPGQGKFILDGSNSTHEWQAYIPREHNLTTVNPTRGFISSANQHPVGDAYPYYTYDYNYEYYRGRRINDRLGLMQDIRPEDMMRLQNDNFNYHAFELLPVMLDSLDTLSFGARQRDAFQALRSWDFFSEPDRVAPTVFEIWWKFLYDMVCDEFDDQAVALYRPNKYNTALILKNYPDHELVDNKSTSIKETSTELYKQTFAMAVDSVNSWSQQNGKEAEWATYKNTTIQHLLRLGPFSRENVKIGGYSNIVNAASRRHGPSWRMVVELGSDGISAWGVYPGSQSGNPGNPKYADMIDDWAQGNYYDMYFLKSSTDEQDNMILLKL